MFKMAKAKQDSYPILVAETYPPVAILTHKDGTLRFFIAPRADDVTRKDLFVEVNGFRSKESKEFLDLITEDMSNDIWHSDYFEDTIISQPEFWKNSGWSVDNPPIRERHFRKDAEQAPKETHARLTARNEGKRA